MPGTHAMLEPSQPRYLQLAKTLIAEIEDGAYPVGALMPTEFALCEQFGASRFTVREAIKQLVQLGMVTRQAGVGTRVVGLRRDGSYRQVIDDLSDLHRFTSETRLRIHERRIVEVSGALAEQLGAREGEAWLYLEALRASPGQPPFALSRIYIHPAFRSLSVAATDEQVPIYTRLEQQFGERIAEVRQQIEGIRIDARCGRLLGIRRGAPGLRVSRTYVNGRGEIVEVAISLHPGSRYSYSQTFHRHPPGAA